MTPKQQPSLEIAGALVPVAGTVLLFFAAINTTGFFGPTSGGLDKKVVSASTEFVAPLTGLPVDAITHERRSLAVSIDNHPDSRPPSGLDKADIVWEVPVEGGITRFLAVFQSQDVERIGPVRSARSYMIPWVRELDAVFAHVGGHHEALRRLRAEDRDINDADAFRAGETYWRDTSRYAPHSTYTTTGRLRALVASRGWSASSTVSSWRFGKPEGEPATEISIEFGTPLFSVDYSYDAEMGVYARELAGASHRLSDRSELATTNVAVMFVKVLGRPEPGTGTLTIETAGEGEVAVFSGGKVMPGRWKKLTPGARTRFYKANGEEVIFSPGTTWIEVIPDTLRENVSWE